MSNRFNSPAVIDKAAQAIMDVMETLLTVDECRTYAKAAIATLGITESEARVRWQKALHEYYLDTKTDIFILALRDLGLITEDTTVKE